GRAAHAAMAPWDGSSALSAMIQTFVAIDAMRLHLRDGSRLHGIITNGGQIQNIIPATTEAQFSCRGRTSRYAEEVARRVVRCAEGAAISTGTRVEHQMLGGYKNMIANLSIASRYAAHCESLGTPSPEAPDNLSTGSTDMGDVSHALPAIHPVFAIARHGEGTCHEDAFVQHADSPRGYDAMIRVGKALALTAYDLLAEPTLLKSAKDEFARREES